MRTLEQNFLKDYISDIALYSQNNPTVKEFVLNINDVDEISLQDKCREFDYAFLGDLSRIISIIMSIVEHPHITASREEIVARIEQVKQLSNEDFTRSIRESSFWKKRGIDMVPQKVYYYQQVDELIIYENKFICLLVDILDQELNQYLDIYTNMLPQIDGSNHLNNAGKHIVLSMKRINLLKKRIATIKNTRFYKIVSASRPISRNVQKTNILIHDNLYKQCYIFYSKFMVYSDSLEVRNDLKQYYLTILIKELANKNYAFCGSSSENELRFTNNNFDITVSTEEEKQGIVLKVRNKEAEKKESEIVFNEQPEAIEQLLDNFGEVPVKQNVDISAYEPEIVDSLVIFNALKRSFQSRLIQSGENTQRYYSEIKNKLLSYRKVHNRLSWNAESFRLGGNLKAKMTIRGKTLCLFLAQNPENFDTNIYHQRNFGDRKKYSDVPLMLKVRSPLGLKRALRLIDILLENVPLDKRFEPHVYSYPYETDDELIERGLIRNIRAKRFVDVHDNETVEDAVVRIVTENQSEQFTTYGDDGDTIIEDVDEFATAEEQNTASKVKNNESEDVEKHLLLISPSLNRDDLIIPDGDYTSIDILTLWNLLSAYDITTAKLVSPNNERELISAFIDSKTAIAEVNHDIYSIICPVCKNKVIENDNGITCPNCHTKYRYLQSSGETYRIWFTDLRRK